MKIILGLLFYILINDISGSENFNHCTERFELVNGDTINFRDTNCVEHGLWDRTYGSGYNTHRSIGKYENGLEVGNWKFIKNYETSHETTNTGLFDKGKRIGIWNTYNSDSIKIKRDEYWSGVLMKEIIISKDQEVVLKKRTYISYLFERFQIVFIVILLGSFFLRIYINSLIYNAINKTSYNLIFKLWSIDAKYHEMSSLLTFHWKINDIHDLKIEKQFSNFLSYLFGILFLVLIFNFIFETITNYNY